MDLLELDIKIGGFKIYVELLDSVENGKMRLPKEVYEIVKKEFSNDFTDLENARRIKQELQPHCLRAIVAPPAKGYNYSWKYTSRK